MMFAAQKVAREKAALGIAPPILLGARVNPREELQANWWRVLCQSRWHWRAGTAAGLMAGVSAQEVPDSCCLWRDLSHAGIRPSGRLR